MRVWLFRTVVCSFCIATGVVAWLTYLNTNSEAIRRKVIEQLQGQFQNVDVEIGSAWLRPLGGISVRDVRLVRRDDPSNPVLLVPTATILHDKEQLAQGRLVIRKIELNEPTVLLRRDVEGHWNFTGLTRPGQADRSCPLLVIRNGTVIYEDRSGGVARPRLEVRDVHWTMLNDPLPLVSFQGRGQSPLGPLKWEGSWQRVQGVLTGSIDLAEVNLTRTLIRDLGRHVSEISEHLDDFEARGDAKLTFRYQPGGRPAFQPDLRVNLHQGHWRHPRLPLRHVEALELKLRYRNEQVTVERFKARSGPTTLTFSLDGMLPPAGLQLDDPQQLLSYLNLSVQNLTLSPELFERLPANLQKIHKAFKPSGPINLDYEFKRDERSWSKRCTIQPQGVTAEYEDFPYPLRDLRGDLVQVTTSTHKDRLDVNLTGQAAQQPLAIAGYAEGDSPNNRLDLRVNGRSLPIDETFLTALGEYRRPVESLHPTGKTDFRVSIQRQPGQTRAETRIHLDFRDVTVRYDAFPYPLEDMTGTLHVNIGKHNRVEFENFRGRHHGGEVTINGADDIAPAGNVLDLRVEAAGVPFDADLARAAGQLQLQSAWQALRPRGRLNCSARLTHIERAAPPNAPRVPSEIDIVFDRIHIDSLLPDFLPYELNNVTTALRFSGNKVSISEVQARHGASRLHIGPSIIVVKPSVTMSEGSPRACGMWGEFKNIQLAPLIPDEEFLCALPPVLRSACTAVQPSGTMSLAADKLIVDLTPAPDDNERNRMMAGQSDGRTVRLTQAPLPERDGPSPWIYWENLSVRMAGASLKLGVRWDDIFGEVASTGAYRSGRIDALSGNLAFKQATTFRQPFQDIHAHLIVNPARAPGVLQVNNLKANVFGGAVTGQGRVMFEPLMRFDLSLNALQVRMEEIARHNRLTSEQLSGRAQAQLYLSGQGGDLSTLRGGGSFDIPRGRIYNLPPLLDLLKFVKLHAPDGTFFEEAHARFRVQGERVHFEQIDLIGSLVSLTGTGAMNLDGTRLKLDVYTIWSRVVQALPGPVRDGANALSHALLKIEMRGSLGGKLEYRQEAMPALTEPVRRLLDRMRPPGAANGNSY